MNVRFVTPRLDRLEEQRGAHLCAFSFEERRPFAGIVGLVDWRLHGHLSRLKIRGFVGGAGGEALLVPLGARLSLSHLLLLGLGRRDALGDAGIRGALARMFEVSSRLGDAPIVVALPGRPEGLVEPAAAMELFLDAYDAHGEGRSVAIVEPSAAQKAMLPVLERYRLKRWVPLMTME